MTSTRANHCSEGHIERGTVCSLKIADPRLVLPNLGCKENRSPFGRHPIRSAALSSHPHNSRLDLVHDAFFCPPTLWKSTGPKQTLTAAVLSLEFPLTPAVCFST